MLITALGDPKDGYIQTIYRSPNGVAESRFAPAALARLEGLKGRALVLVTDNASKYYDDLAQELEVAGLRPEKIPIPNGEEKKDGFAIFEALAGRVDPDDEIVLDVTFGLRHLPFVYFAALTYLSALEGVRITGIFYGGRELAKGEGAPIIDVTYLFRLVEWYHALASGRDAGDFRAMARLLKSDVASLGRAGAEAPELEKASGYADALSKALVGGLPIEAGIHAHSLLQALEATTSGQPGEPTARRAIDELATVVQPWRLDAGADKKSLQLDASEIKRQLELASFWAKLGNVSAALLTMREALVNMVALNHRRTDWLERSARKDIEAVLSGKKRPTDLSTMIDERIVETWRDVSDCRHRFAHAGMCKSRVAISPASLQGFVQRCKELLPQSPLPVEHERGERVLLTPLGLSPGVLYTAVQLVETDRAIIITSREGRERISEALEHAGKPDLACEILVLDAPLRDFDKAGTLLRAHPNLKSLLGGAREVTMNATGGTTAMQFVVERLAEEASRLGTPVRRVALIDERSSEEQRANPYVLGELLPLGKARQEELEEA